LSAAVAPAILFLHGQPGGARDWERVTTAIGERAPTLTFDRPGWDERSAARGIAGNVTAALSVLDAHRVGRAILVGHSFGAAVAAWLAIEHPERVAGLVLVAPAANVRSLYLLDHALAAPIVGPVASVAALAGPGAVLGIDPAARWVGRRLGLDWRYLDAAGRALRRPASWRAFVVEQRALVRELPLLEPRLWRIAVPAAVMIGSADVVVPAVSARRLAGQIHGAQLEVIERAGHLLPLRHPDRVAAAALALACVS
jgi:pimeloyl-ACP methyl ester carboxylesterase